MPKKTDKTKYVGDCSPSGIAKRAAKVYMLEIALLLALQRELPKYIKCLMQKIL